jgi:hypothetical protein
MKDKEIPRGKSPALCPAFRGLIIACICSGSCLGQGNWTWNNPLPGARLFSIDGKFVGLTKDRYMTSQDGISWTIRPSRLSAYQRFSLDYGNGQFILGADNGQGYGFSTSKDGFTWSQGTSFTGKGGNSYIIGIAYGGSRYLATTSDGRILVSGNGQDWSQPDSAFPWQSINPDIPPLFAGDHFAVFADTGFGSHANTLWTSSDGSVWARGNTLKQNPNSLLYGNNTYVSLSYAWEDSCNASADGNTWTAVRAGWGGYARYGNFLDGEFLVYGSKGDIWGSTDGMNWRKRASTLSPIVQIVKGPGGYLAVREANPYDRDECPILSSPLIAGPWKPVRDYSPVQGFYGIAYGDGKFVAAGDGFSFSEDGGASWSVSNMAGSDPPYHSVAFGAHAFVATGVPLFNMLAYSTDGKTWADSQFKDLSVLHSVAFGAGRFVAVGAFDSNHRAVITSIDGRVWSAPDTSGNCRELYSVEYVNGEFVAWGDCAGGYEASPDGHTWRLVKAKKTPGEGLAYGNGKYLSTLSANQVKTSVDLDDWKDTTVSVYAAAQGIGFGFGKFILVGNAGMIHTSEDGEHWIQDSSTQFYSLNLQAVAFGEDRIVAVGTGGAVLVSLQGAAASVRPMVARIPGNPAGARPRFHQGEMKVEHGSRAFRMDGRESLVIPRLKRSDKSIPVSHP